jgi:hypothetical protein
MQKMLWTIFHVTIAAISTYQIESIDMDVVINPTQVHVHVHWHCKLEKK